MKHANIDIALPVHHVPGGGFRNPWPGSQPHGVGGLIKWMLTRRRRKAPTEMVADDPSVPPEAAFPASTSELSRGLAITAVGHSTFLVTSPSAVFLTDPVWGERASPLKFAGPKRNNPPGVTLESITRLDAVFLSHDHYDHLDRTTVRKIAHAFPETRWFAPLGVSRILQRWGVRDVTEMDWWQSGSYRDLGIACTPAMHFSGRYPWKRNASLWCGWVIDVFGYRLFFAGDTGLHPEFAEIARRFGPIDVAILPIGAYEPRWFMKPIHMNPEDAISAYGELSAGSLTDRCVFLASHWGTFKLTEEPLTEPPLRLRRAWGSAGISYELLWVLAPGESRMLTHATP